MEVVVHFFMNKLDWRMGKYSFLDPACHDKPPDPCSRSHQPACAGYCGSEAVASGIVEPARIDVNSARFARAQRRLAYGTQTFKSKAEIRKGRTAYAAANSA